jgi:hypothetical protein
MEVSDKEMRRFVEKLLEEAGQDTLTQRIIRQRFIGYLGVDEDSFGDHNKNRLRQIVLETMMPTTNHQKPVSSLICIRLPLYYCLRVYIYIYIYVNIANSSSTSARIWFAQDGQQNFNVS